MSLPILEKFGDLALIEARIITAIKSFFPTHAFMTPEEMTSLYFQYGVTSTSDDINKIASKLHGDCGSFINGQLRYGWDCFSVQVEIEKSGTLGVRIVMAKLKPDPERELRIETEKKMDNLIMSHIRTKFPKLIFRDYPPTHCTLSNVKVLTGPLDGNILGKLTSTFLPTDTQFSVQCRMTSKIGETMIDVRSYRV